MSSLPIETVLPELKARLASHFAVVLQAPPGAGKTTMVPLALLDEPWLKGQSILMLEPRRLAARAAAARMSQLRGESVGLMVGYRIRFDSQVSKQTRIEVLTEGILTRRLQTDSALEGVGLVIFDEFHERHLHADLALALTVDCQRGLREDLKILVMSATLDGVAIARLLNDAPIVTSEGRMFPVETIYAGRDPEGPLAPHVAETVQRALREREGDALVFLPGAREIRQTQELLEARLQDVDILPLYGDLPWEAQDRALRPGTRRKVVLATPIAETSLTIEGIRNVVDSGYARSPQFDPSSGLSRLVTHRISRASSEQRAGRAGRLAPGACYRLWTETTQRGLVPFATPEIRAADLAPLALELAAWGVKDANALAWLDPPPAPAMAQARELLAELDALDTEGGITGTGREMVRLPVHPRLAHMLLVARPLGLGALACDVAALLSERDVMAGEARRSVDFAIRLDALAAFRRQGRQAALSRKADPNACSRVVQAADQWRRLIKAERRDGEAANGPSMARGPRLDPIGEVNDAEVGLLIALAYPDRVAQQRGLDSTRYLLANGRGARLHESEIRMRQPWLAIATLDDAPGRAGPAGLTEGMIYLASAITPDQLRRHLSSHIRTAEGVHWDEREQAVSAARQERYGGLVLESKPTTNPEPELVRAAMVDGIRHMGIESLPWTDEAREFQARVLCMRHWSPDEECPDLSDSALLATLDAWLAPYLDGITRRSHLSRLDLHSILRAQLDWKRQQELDSEAPTHLAVPSGNRHRLEYKPGETPVLAVKLQEMFGLADTPRIARGRVPVTLHLLSPARRPIQVTQDLKGFWERTYLEVKKEMKGRYPRHPWPDDPWNATPTARAKRRL
ncbi:MAG: ATP-dependent helicase HrpB [Pseudomonadota bacterium]